MGVNRRELLQYLLGLPPALALGCAGRRRPPLPPGDIAFSPEITGHRYIAAGFAARPTNWRRRKVVVVGGGVAGLSAAYHLHRAGVTDLELFELDSAAGGTARSGKSQVSAYPWGAHYITVPMRDNLPLLRLLREMGVVLGEDERGQPLIAEEALCRDPEERLHYYGRFYEGLYPEAGEPPAERADRVRFDREITRWATFRDGRGRRGFGIPAATGSDDAEITALDKLSMAEWMDRQKLFGKRLRWMVDYACRDDYGATAAQTSAWAGIFYFASRLAGAAADSQAVITWPEGNGRLVAHLQRAVQSLVRLNTPVVELVPTATGVDVIAFDGEQPVGIHAERVVFAAPQFLARHIIRELDPERGATFQYSPWLVANLHLAERPTNRGFPLAWDNVSFHSPSLGYVCATHQRGLDHGPTVLTYYLPLTDDDPRAGRRRLLAAGQPEWAEAVLSDLERMHPRIRELVTRLDIARWGHAMVLPRPGFIWGGALTRAAEPFRGIHFAHSDLAGIALFEEAFHHGTRAAGEILAAFGMEAT